MIVFSGTSNQSLAKKLAKLLKVKLGKVELSRFDNGEVRVWVSEKFHDDTAVVVQSLSLSPDEHLVEFCLLSDALKRMGVTRLIGVVPWLGYSKQDKVFRPGEPLSVKVIAQIMQVVPLTRLITFDLHNPAILGFFDVAVTNLTARPLFAEYFQTRFGKENGERQNLIIAAPDAGAVKNSTKFAEELGVGVTYIDKERDLKTGKVRIKGISRKVVGKTVLMIDDMIATGSTLVSTSEFLHKKGANKVIVAATHHLYLPGVDERLAKSHVDELIVTDTISPTNVTKLKTKTEVVSISTLLANELL